MIKSLARRMREGALCASVRSREQTQTLLDATVLILIFFLPAFAEPRSNVARKSSRISSAEWCGFERVWIAPAVFFCFLSPRKPIYWTPRITCYGEKKNVIELNATQKLVNSERHFESAFVDTMAVWWFDAGRLFIAQLMAKNILIFLREYDNVTEKHTEYLPKKTLWVRPRSIKAESIKDILRCRTVLHGEKPKCSLMSWFMDRSEYYKLNIIFNERFTESMSFEFWQQSKRKTIPYAISMLNLTSLPDTPTHLSFLLQIAAINYSWH